MGGSLEGLEMPRVVGICEKVIVLQGAARCYGVPHGAALLGGSPHSAALLRVALHGAAHCQVLFFVKYR